MPEREGTSRRRLLGLGLASAWALLTGARAGAAPALSERALAFRNLHTEETLVTVYWAEGRYLPEALADIDYILRDFRTEETAPIEVGLLDLLHELQQVTDSAAPFEIISGYRSPATNAMLASTSAGISRKSFHMFGMAADIRLADLPLKQLRKAAQGLGRGGVGYYPSSNFIHLDIGPVRSW